MENPSFVNSGHLHLSRKEYREAINDFTGALSLNPDDAQTYNNRGVAFEKLGSLQLALADYDRALELDPSLLFPRINRGNAFLLMGEYDRSIAAYGDAIARAPDDGSIYSRRALAHFDKGDYQAAAQDFEEARRLGHITVESELHRGHAYHALRNPEEAIGALSEAIELDSSNALALGLRGWNLAKIGRVAEARSDLLECLRLEPDNAQAAFSLGVVLQTEGDLENALEFFQRAAALGDTAASEVAALVAQSLRQTVEGGAARASHREERPADDQPSYARFKSHQTSHRAEDVPFTRFEGWIKCMRPSDLDDHQILALKLTFGRFFEEHQTSQSVVEADESFRGPGPREQPFAFRRFAGGPDLPGGRYYAVCNDSSGDDGNSLRGELLSYVDPKISGPVSIWDFCDPMLQGVMHAHLLRERMSQLPKASIGVTFHTRRGVASPFFSQLKEGHALGGGPLVHMDNDFTVYFPLRVEQVSIEKTIDLRLEHVREWFAARVFAGLPTACYVYGKDIKDAGSMLDVLRTAKTELHIDVEDVRRAESLPPDSMAKTKKMATDRAGFLFYGTHPEGANNQLVCPQRTFYSLLPILMFHPRGGSAITEAIGCWLREIGAGALVFPSARSNTHLHVEDGEIKHMRGWCLVDYRGAPIPPKTLRIIRDPVSNIDSRKPFRSSAPDGSKIHWKGSFQVQGIEERQQMDWVYGQELFWQTQYFQKERTLHEKRLGAPGASRDPESLFSLADLRAAIKAGAISLDYLLESTEIPHGVKTVGQWLAEYVNERIPDTALSGSALEYGDEWFMYRLNPYYEPQIICPICEYQRVWSIERDPVDEKCPSCEYEREQQSTPDEVRKRYFRLCDR